MSRRGTMWRRTSPTRHRHHSFSLAPLAPCSKRNGDAGDGVLFSTYAALVSKRQVREARGVFGALPCHDASPDAAPLAASARVFYSADAGYHSGHPQGSAQTRADQMVEWLGGAQAEGCILFDEAHKAKNLIPEKVRRMRA